MAKTHTLTIQITVVDGGHRATLSALACGVGIAMRKIERHTAAGEDTLPLYMHIDAEAVASAFPYGSLETMGEKDHASERTAS